jgi:hypothetical protein
MANPKPGTIPNEEELTKPLEVCIICQKPGTDAEPLLRMPPMSPRIAKKCFPAPRTKETEDFIGGSVLHVRCGENATLLGKPMFQLATKEDIMKTRK